MEILDCRLLVCNFSFNRYGELGRYGSPCPQAGSVKGTTIHLRRGPEVGFEEVGLGASQQSGGAALLHFSDADMAVDAHSRRNAPMDVFLNGIGLLEME